MENDFGVITSKETVELNKQQLMAVDELVGMHEKMSRFIEKYPIIDMDKFFDFFYPGDSVKNYLINLFEIQEYNENKV